MEAYNYRFIGGIENVYRFETDNEIGYEVKFRDSSYIFDGYAEKSIEVYEMSISVVETPETIRPPLDPKVSETIAVIFRNFFHENHEQAIIYICDSSDNRQLARKRKFDQWINYFGGEFLKFDGEISDIEGVIYYTSLIIHYKNSQRNHIQEIFYELVVSQQK